MTCHVEPQCAFSSYLMPDYKCTSSSAISSPSYPGRSLACQNLK